MQYLRVHTFYQGALRGRGNARWCCLLCDKQSRFCVDVATMFSNETFVAENDWEEEKKMDLKWIYLVNNNFTAFPLPHSLIKHLIPYSAPCIQL